MTTAAPLAPSRGAAGLYLVTGATALLYQVLWQRELGLIFGNSGEAAGATLAAFFLGLAAGGMWWGRRAPRTLRPLLAFGALEVGVCVLALLALGLVPLYRQVLVPGLGLLEAAPWQRLGVRLLLAGIVVGPPAFLMGGTFPMLGEHAVRAGRSLPGAGSILYSLNTLGAAAGALLAGFVLPRELGYRGTYFLALAVGVGAGVLAMAWGRRAQPARPARARSVKEPEHLSRASLRPGGLAAAAAEPRGGCPIWAVALWSGVATLALEVLLTRMFAQALQNSVYTFAALLAVFLLALAVGALGAHALVRLRLPTAQTLRVLLLLGGVACVLTPRMFALVAPDPMALGGRSGFAPYVASVFLHVLGVVGPVGFLLGLVLPYLLAVESARRPERARLESGRLVGRLMALNTLGALVGALLGAFVLPPLLGVWPAAVLLGSGYFVLALSPTARTTGGWAANAAIALLLGLCIAEAGVQGPRAMRWALRPGERLLEAYEGSAGRVAVVKVGDDLKLRLNQAYTLGGTSEPRWEEFQTHIPLCLHPAPRRVLYLGMGTGITAGAALAHPVEQVVVAELIPEVVEAAREHFAPWVRGLFESARVQVLSEDARTVLAAGSQRYDAVIGDLFLPWQRGTALLFTEDHFRSVRLRLAPGGLFAQWLPLYQLGREEFFSIVRSFLAAFPRAGLLRGDLFSGRPILALVGREDDTALDAQALAARWIELEARSVIEEGTGAGALPFLLYAGALVAGAGPWDAVPLSTDDRPWIEFEAPRAARARSAGQARAFVGSDLLEFQAGLIETLPPQQDPWWSKASPAQQRLIQGGRWLYAYAVYDALGPDARDQRREAFAEFLRHVPAALRPRLSRWVR